MNLKRSSSLYSINNKNNKSLHTILYLYKKNTKYTNIITQIASEKRSTMSDRYSNAFALLQIISFLGSMRWFVSLRKRYNPETIQTWLVPHTGIKGIPGVVGTGVAWCVISSFIYLISPYINLDQESYKAFTPTGGKEYFLYVFTFVQFAFLCSLFQRRNSDWLSRLLVLIVIWIIMYMLYTNNTLDDPFNSGISFLFGNLTSLYTVKTFLNLWIGRKVSKKES